MSFNTPFLSPNIIGRSQGADGGVPGGLLLDATVIGLPFWQVVTAIIGLLGIASYNKAVDVAQSPTIPVGYRTISWANTTTISYTYNKLSLYYVGNNQGILDNWD